MRRLHTHRRFLAVGAAGLLAAGLAACSSSSTSSGGTNSNTGAATGKTLVMESSPESTITQSFNPFVPTGAPWGMGATGLTYDPLIPCNPATFADPSPVGTGPMKLSSFTPQGFTLAKNPSYWQASQVQVPKVFFPVYTSNTSALSALFSGHIDWTGNYIPGLQHSFISTNPEFHHHWEAPGGTNSLVPNMNKWPTNQLPVRQAISAAINRQLLAAEGESGLENPVLNATGLTPQLFDAWSGPVASMTVSATGSAAAAAQILQKAGYIKGSDGFFAKGGKEVTITITNPSAYT